MANDVLCRLCSLNSDDHTNIFGEIGIKLKMCDIIKEHFRCEISETDSLPKFVCEICWSITESFHELYQKVKKLEEQYSRIKIETDLSSDPFSVPGNMEPTFDEDSQGVSIIKLEPSFNEDSTDAQVIYDNDSDGITQPSEVIGDDEKMQNDATKNSSDLKYPNGSQQNYGKVKLPESSEQATSEKELVICDICKKAFTSKTYLKKHLQWHTENENQSDQNEVYRKFIIDNFDRSCDLCEVVFTTFHDARRHYKYLHNEKKGYMKCCDMKLNEYWLVIDHINSHLNPKIFKCELCNKIYADRKKFYLHKRRHKQAILMPFICDHCGRHFRNKEMIKRHMFISHVKSEPKFECEMCHKRFQLVSLLRNHHYSVHREKKVYVTCEICGKSFKVKANFDKHMLSHVDKSERLTQRKQCEHCGEWLMTKSGIYYHDTIHTSGLQKCDQCEMELPHKLALLAHIRNYHRAPKHKCNYCGKTYNIGSKLKEHEESHTRHNVYPCDYCEKKFSVLSSRQTHMRRNHPEQLKERKKMRKMLQLTITKFP